MDALREGQLVHTPILLNPINQSSINFSLTLSVQWTIDNYVEPTHILGRMKIVFADKRLELIHTDRAHELGLPFAVIKGAREKLHFLAEAPDERTLRNWKSLNYKRREGTDDQRQIRINGQYRIIFRLENDTIPPLITVLEIGDPH